LKDLTSGKGYSPSRKVELLREKLALLQEYHRLALQQKRALAGENMDELNRLLAEKQQLIEKINVLDREAAGAEKEPYPNSTQPATGEALVKNLEEKIIRQLQLIHTAEQETRDNLEQNYNRLLDAAAQLRASKKAVTTYSRKNKKLPSFFVDKKR